MPARPHDAEEPRPGEPSAGDPDEPQDVETDGAAHPGDDDGTPPPDDDPGEPSVPGRRGDIGPEDVDARWVQIVSQLGAADPRSCCLLYTSDAADE